MKIDATNFAFIKGAYSIEGDSTRSIKQKISEALNDNKRYNFGAISTKGDQRYLFSSDKAGLMPGATIFSDVVEYERVLVLCSKDDSIYFLLIKNKKVIYENILDRNSITEIQTNQLKLALFDLGEDATVISSEEPIVKKDGGLLFKGNIELPHNRDRLVIKPALADLLVTDKLLSSVEFKQLTINGQKIQRQWYYSIAAIVIAGITVSFVNILEDTQDNSSFTQQTLSKISDAAEASRNYVLLTKDKNVEAPSYEGLYSWYMEESISPYKTLQIMHRHFRLFESVDGWEVIQGKFSIENNNPIITFKLREGKGADIQAVTDLAVRGDWKISFKDKILTLFKVSQTEPLFSNAARFQISSYEKYLSSGIKDWWDNTSFEATDFSDKVNPQAQEDAPPSEGDKKIAEESSKSKKSFTKRLIKISKPEYTSFDLQSFGSFLKGHPFSLLSLTMTKEGVEIEDSNESSTRRSQRRTEETEDNLNNKEFAAFNADYELILAGVTTR